MEWKDQIFKNILALTCVTEYISIKIHTQAGIQSLN